MSVSAKTTGVGKPARRRWPDEEFESISRRVAASVMPLLLQPHRWVHRRVESIEFMDAARLRRRTSVDFTIPARRFIPITVAPDVDVAFIPIALLAKRVLKAFDVRDEAGQALPALTQTQNSAISGSMLKSLASTILHRQPLDASVARDIDDIVNGDVATATAALVNFARAQGPGDRHQRTTLWNSSRFRTLATDLARQFVLFVPLANPAGTRRVLKFSYEEEFGRRNRTVAQFFGIQPVEFAVIAPSVGMAESYHTEIEAPDELVVSSAQLLELRSNGSPSELSSDAGVFRAHLHAANLTRGTVALIDVRFRLRRSGLVVAAFLIGVLTTTVLASGWALHDLHVGSSPDVAAALLVALPGLFATYLARPGEHRLVKRLVGGLRLLIVVLAALSYAAAGSLAMDVSTTFRAWVWETSCIASASATAIIGIALATSKWRDWRTTKV